MCLHVCVHVCADIPVSACDHASRGQRATLVKPSHVVFFQLSLSLVWCLLRRLDSEPQKSLSLCLLGSGRITYGMTSHFFYEGSRQVTLF